MKTTTKRASEAAKKAWATRRRNEQKIDETVDLRFPLAGVEKAVRVVVDLKRQTVRFKTAGQGWKSLNLWIVAESAGIDPDKADSK